MNETLEAMARAIFKDWFVDFGPTRAKMEGRAPYLAPEIWALFPDRLDDEGKPRGLDWHAPATTRTSAPKMVAANRSAATIKVRETDLPPIMGPQIEDIEFQRDGCAVSDARYAFCGPETGLFACAPRTRLMRMGKNVSAKYVAFN